jgi:tartrate dehydratase alpha subunit/fumarate hydratase class I-like protein
LYKEVNTGTNLPAQIDLYATDGDEYKFLCIAKGGGAAAGPDALTFFTHDDRGAGVLTGGQNAFGGDIGVRHQPAGAD